MTVFQLIAVLFALFMIYVVTIHHKKRTLSSIEVSFWYSMWVLFGIFAVFPALLQGISTTLHFNRVFDLIVAVTFMILSAVVFLTYFGLRENERKLECFVRVMALKEASEIKTKKKISKK